MGLEPVSRADGGHFGLGSANRSRRPGGVRGNRRNARTGPILPHLPPSGLWLTVLRVWHTIPGPTRSPPDGGNPSSSRERVAEHVRADASIHPGHADRWLDSETGARAGRERLRSGRLLELALFLRLLAAAAVEVFVRRSVPPRVCVFPDAEYYWSLAGTIRRGTLYEVVEWGDIPHFALRTPGYPAFLAGCRVLLGDRPFGARLVQAGLGALDGRARLPADPGADRPGQDACRRRRPALVDPAGGRTPDGHPSLLRGHVGPAAFRSGVRALDAGIALGHGRGLESRRLRDGREHPTAAPGRIRRRGGQRRGHPGSSLLGPVRPGDGGDLGLEFGFAGRNDDARPPSFLLDPLSYLEL